MAIMCGVVGALSAFYHDSLDINNPQHREITAYRLIAKMPTIAAMCYKYALGQPFMYPRNDLGYAENFLHMMFGNPCEESKISPTLAKAMDASSSFTPITSRTRPLYRPSGRFLRCQPVRLYRCGHLCPVGPGTRWRQRSRTEHAG